MYKILLLTTFLLFSMVSGADENSTQKGIEINTCGLTEKGNINPFSFEICKEDTAFNMVYSMLGFLYDEYVFPFSYTKHISVEKTKEQQAESTQYYKRFGVIFKDIFRAMSHITIALLFLLISYFTVSAIFNSVQGDFLGKKWDKIGTLRRFVIGGILITPINGVSVFQIIILNISLFSIALGNFPVSGFLAFMENQVPAISEQGDFNKIIDENAEKSIYFDYALMDIKKLTKIAMCRNRSSQYLLQGKITANEDAEEFLKCNSPSPSSVTTSIEEPGFIRYSFSNNKGRSATGIDFKNTITKECGADITTEYSCGSIVFPNASIDLRGYELSQSEIDEKIINAGKRISYSSSINEDIYKEFSMFWDELNKSYKNYDDLSLAQKSSTRSVVSYYFHQMLQNELTVGLLINTKTNDEDGFNILSNEIVVEKNKTLNMPIIERMEFANNIAKNIESLDCIQDFSKLVKTKNAADVVKNRKKTDQAISECLYTDATGKVEVLGLVNGEIPFVTKENKESDVKKIDDEIKRITDESSVQIRKKANKLYMIKKGTMDSFSKSIKDFHADKKEGFFEDKVNFKSQVLVQSRQLGFGSMGSLMRRIVQNKEGEAKLKIALLNGLRYSVNSDSSMVSTDIEQKNNKYPSLTNSLDKVFNKFVNNRKIKKIEELSVNKNLDRFIESTNENNKIFTNENFIESLIQTPIRIFNKFKSNIGMAETNDTNNSLLEDCVRGNGNCGIPIKHPMEAISSLGKDLMGASVSVLAFSMAGTEAFNESNRKKIMDRGQDTSKKGKISGKSSVVKKGALGTFGKFLDGNIFIYITDLLMSFFWILFAVGFVASYFIPLIPFFIFTIALVGWVVILFQILLISNIWVVLFFQPKNQGENKEGIQAAYNAIMQLLLKPLLITTALILSWWVFTVLITIVNLTIGPMFGTLNGGGHLLGLVDITFGITFYVMIIYIIIKISFKLIEELPKKVFSMIGVTTDKEDEEQFKKLGEALIGYQVVNKVTEGSKNKSSEASSLSKKVRENKTEDKREGR